MNTNITFLQHLSSNTLLYLPTTKLSSYILSEEEQQYIQNLTNDTTSVISTLILSADIKAGSSLYTQPALNKIYARYDDPDFTENDRTSIKDFMNTRMVGNDIVKFNELKVETVET